MVQDMNLVRHWAKRYWEMGLNPLPSSGKAKRPAMDGPTIMRYRKERIPQKWLETWWAPNIQIPLGVRWGYCVIDIDGKEGLREWYQIIETESSLPLGCWLSGIAEFHNGTRFFDRGMHLWFRTPHCHFFPTVHLWRGDDKHSGISVLGDGALVVAPPSIHVDRGTRYEWLVGPDALPEPAVIPSWLFSYIDQCRSERAASRPRKERPRPSGLDLPGVTGRRYERDEVLYALGDRKHEIAKAYGLEVKRHPNTSGFYECRSIDREDQKWSCTIDPRTGVYKDWATGQTLSFFSLLMKLDPRSFPNFPVTVNQLGAYALGTKRSLS
jgi:hypothetical protein